MNDIRRTILWVIFGFSIVLLWDQWQIHNGRPATFFPTPAPATATAPAQDKPADVPEASAQSASGAAALPDMPETAPVVREKVTVSTDVLRLTFDGQGGAVVNAELLDYAQNESLKQPFVLFEDSAKRVYVAQTGLVGGDFPTHKTVMNLLPGDRELKDGQDELQVRFESPEQGGVKLIKTFTLKRGSYAIGVKHEVVNTGSAAVTPQLYLQLMRDGTHEGADSAFYSTYTGPAFYSEEQKFQKVSFEDITKGKASFQETANSGYVAMVQHYFASAWLLGEGIYRDNFARKVGNDLFAAGLITPLGTIQPGETKTLDARLFAGPQLEKVLEALAPGLELVKDYGWLTILAKPLYWVLLSSVEIRHASWLWISDLSAKDPLFILPVLMLLSTMLQTALNPVPPDPMQAKMMWIMPLIFSVMFFMFPAGLVLYWLTNNILSIAQQWVINTRMGVPPQFNLPSFLKKTPDSNNKKK